MVEAIIVAAVVAVLAITASMVYRGYITDTRQQTVTNLAETAAAAANAYLRRTGETPGMEDLQLHLPNPDRFNIAINEDNNTVTVTDADHSSITATAHY